ncbi:MAG: hypothetical protein IPJ71_18420 [Bdellovibrionales bacterium]|nr:hypothetical protein [Bdellovibrionales bacterium]
MNEDGEYMPHLFMVVRGSTKVFFASKRKLEVYEHYTKQKLVRLFDIHRNRDIFGFQEDSRSEEAIARDGDVHARRVLMYDKTKTPSGSFARGSQIIGESLTDAQALDVFTDRDLEQEEQYCTYIVHDWKNKKVTEVSCAPGATANYFTESELPFETSPAFFKPDVLLKYKADPDKYEISSRTINCIGGWYLQTYDIDDAGQVSTYPCYLRHLPYSEQLYWKSFNEKPKAGLSDRAFKTDFEGKWADAQPIDTLKALVKRVPTFKVNDKEYVVFSPTIKDFDGVLNSLNLVVTNGLEEWKSETIKLASLCRYSRESQSFGAC